MRYLPLIALLLLLAGCGPNHKSAIVKGKAKMQTSECTVYRLEIGVTRYGKRYGYTSFVTVSETQWKAVSVGDAVVVDQSGGSGMSSPSYELAGYFTDRAEEDEEE